MQKVKFILLIIVVEAQVVKKYTHGCLLKICIFLCERFLKVNAGYKIPYYVGNLFEPNDNIFKHDNLILLTFK